jgi:hypothetical protein
MVGIVCRVCVPSPLPSFSQSLSSFTCPSICFPLQLRIHRITLLCQLRLPRPNVTWISLCRSPLFSDVARPTNERTHSVTTSFRTNNWKPRADGTTYVCSAFCADHYQRCCHSTILSQQARPAWLPLVQGRHHEAYANRRNDCEIFTKKQLCRPVLTISSGKKNALESPLLRLPAELRALIWEYALGGQKI